VAPAAGLYSQAPAYGPARNRNGTVTGAPGCPGSLGSFTDSPPSPGSSSLRSHRGRGDDRAMADVLVVAAIAFFVAAMLGLIWALGRI
jgi:hypothetical protein